ncbi:hypothetical protein PA598K_00430 [Paenibacillus sp. 598K]|uniref:AraC family transcriptional regulator n=1 Tax=Paenibacillus sp. 598K TaxID=1117987 RepID=UPI000FFAF551|nr:AraC family transcriptional regulator [Paenibacillus sp. 598K]GBF72193.1 hypothetical protein PA598K_00430 [Paenibacillus sp. 598K]
MRESIEEGQQTARWQSLSWWGMTELRRCELQPGERCQSVAVDNKRGYELLAVCTGDVQLQAATLSLAKQEQLQSQAGTLSLSELELTVIASPEEWRLEAGAAGATCYRLRFIPLMAQGAEVASNETANIEMDEDSALPGFLRELSCAIRSSQALALLSELERLRLLPDWRSALQAQQHFYELLELVVALGASDPSEGADTAHPAQRLQAAIDYAQQHYDRAPSVDELAALAGLGRSHFTRLFKAQTGQSPLEYMNGLRIERAKSLLSQGDEPLAAVAEQSGFSSEYYLGRRFKQLVGVSPGQYRRNTTDPSRVFAPFLEDYLVALGLRPCAQIAHSRWGRQDYLGLQDIAEYTLDEAQEHQMEKLQPSFVLLDDGAPRWGLDAWTRQSPTLQLPQQGEAWRSILLAIADQFGKTVQAEQLIEHYETKAQRARLLLEPRLDGRTVALLRISAQRLVLYGGSAHGYVGPVLYGDLGLQPHPMIERLAAAERRIDLTLDQLAALDADVLFITFDKDEGEGRELLSSPLWRSLPAVRRGAVYEVDFFSWMNYGVLANHRKIDDVLRFLA